MKEGKEERGGGEGERREEGREGRKEGEEKAR